MKEQAPEVAVGLNRKEIVKSEKTLLERFRGKAGRVAQCLVLGTQLAVGLNGCASQSEIDRMSRERAQAKIELVDRQSSERTAELVGKIQAVWQRLGWPIDGAALEEIGKRAARIDAVERYNLDLGGQVSRRKETDFFFDLALIPDDPNAKDIQENHRLQEERAYQMIYEFALKNYNGERDSESKWIAQALSTAADDLSSYETFGAFVNSVVGENYSLVGVQPENYQKAREIPGIRVAIVFMGHFSMDNVNKMSPYKSEEH